jgi:hypothetical protein
MTLTYSNPRMHAEIADWPMGGQSRGVATFQVEAKPGKGERATRTTRRDRDGRVGAAKALTFARKMRIVDGDDGRTYIIALTMYGHITVFQSNMQYNEESIFEADPRYAAVRALFEVPL